MKIFIYNILRKCYNGKKKIQNTKLKIHNKAKGQKIKIRSISPHLASL